MVQTATAQSAPPTTVHCGVGSGLLVDDSPAAACPFALAPDQALTVPAGARVVLEGEGLRPWTGPKVLPPGPAQWEGAAEPLSGPAARAWLERVGESDLGVLVSLEISALSREGRTDEALAVVEANLAEHPGHRGLLALRQVRRHELGLPAAEPHRQGPGPEAEAVGSEGQLTRNVFGTDDRVLVTSRSYPWRAIGLIKPSGCTGTLVGARHVLTAAHCLYVEGSHTQLIDGPLTFHAGARSGYSEDRATVVRYLVPPGWSRGDRAHDWALLELDRALGNDLGWFGVQSTTLASVPRGTSFTQAGYSGDVFAGGSATSDPSCQVRGSNAYGGTLMVDCDITRGDSGSPMFVDTGNGAVMYAMIVAEYRHGSSASLYLSHYADDYASLAIPLAAAAAQLALQTAPPATPQPTTSAWDLYVQGRKELQQSLPATARNTLKRCVAIDSQMTGCWWELGWAYWVQGDHAQTVTCWERVRDLDPNWPELYTYLPQARARSRGAW